MASRIISHTCAACKALLGRREDGFLAVASSTFKLLGRAGDAALLQERHRQVQCEAASDHCFYMFDPKFKGKSYKTTQAFIHS